MSDSMCEVLSVAFASQCRDLTCSLSLQWGLTAQILNQLLENCVHVCVSVCVGIVT